jgi:hypothetical protein
LHLTTFFFFFSWWYWWALHLPSRHSTTWATPPAFLALVLLFFISFFHMCIQWLGHYSPLPPTPSLMPPLPHFQAETVLPLPLILLKREYKQ